MREKNENYRRDFIVGLGATVALSAFPPGCASTTKRGGEGKVKTMYRPGMFPVTFIGASTGQWKVDRMTTLRGDALGSVGALDVVPNHDTAPGLWSLRGVTGHVRYVERSEKGPLDDISPPLERPEARRAALIPIRKSTEWWTLPQDERRAIFEQRSRHIADSMAYLPRIARRLYHARELGEQFDFLTWFEFAPEHTQAFDDLLGLLRSREEWTFVDREIELRLSR